MDTPVIEVRIWGDAERFGVRRPLDLLAEVRAAMNSWQQFAKAAGLHTTTANTIAADFELI